MYNEVLFDKVGRDALSLYMHYYFTVRWQKTNQPFALDDYCKKGLKWGSIRMANAKRKLKELKWITPIATRNEKGRITGHYIKLNFIVKNRTLQKVFPQIEEDTSRIPKNMTWVHPRVGFKKQML
jgi:hypothetical protein